MTAEELLMPRFEVINIYPQSIPEHSMGSIVVLDRKKKSGIPFVVQGSKSFYAPYFEAYPHIFRKLNWWDYRTKDQMPKRIKSLAFPDEDYIETIQEWDMDKLFGYVNINTRSGCDLTLWKPELGYIPVD